MSVPEPAIVRPVEASAEAEAPADPDELLEQAHLAVTEGRDARAATLAAQALALLRASAGPTDARIAEALELLAGRANEAGYYDVASHRYRAALEVRRAHPNDGHALARTAYDLGAALESSGYYRDAEVVLAEAVALATAADGPRSQLVADSMFQRAMALSNLREFDDALALALEGLEILKGLHGDDAPALANGFNELGLVYERARRFDDAATAYERALALDPAYISATHNLALVYNAQRRYDEAADLFQQVLDADVAERGWDHPITAGTLHNFAAALRGQGEYDRALELYQQSLDVKRRFLGDQHVDLMPTLTGIGVVYAMTDRDEEAEAPLTEAVQIWDAHPTDGMGWGASAAFELGKLHSRLERWPEAAEVIDAALGRAAPLGDEHHTMQNLLSQRLIVHHAEGELSEARALAARVRAAPSDGFSPDVVERTFRTAEPRLRACFPQGGRITIDFTVSPNGRTSTPRLLQTTGNQTADACAVRIVNGFRYRPGPDEAEDFTYPIRFAGP